MNVEIFCNYTPHTVTLVHGDGSEDYMFSMGVARVAGVTKDVGIIAGWPVKVTEYGDVSGLPAPEPGVGYIVSRMVAAAVPHRTDLFVPGGLVRDDEGRVIGCTHLEKV